MALGDIDLTLEKHQIDVFLAKPDKTIIAKMNESFNKKLTLKLGGISELTFSLPYEVDLNRKNVRNKNVDLIKERYLVKVLFANQEMWFIVNGLSKAMNDTDQMDVECYLLPYELNSKLLKVFSEEALNIYQVLNGGVIVDPSGSNKTIVGILAPTKWTLGYVDGNIATKYRGFDFSNLTLLDAIFKVAETFNALIIWHTNTRTIDFVDAENYGIDRGLYINYGRYLKSLNRSTKGDEIVTRLKLFGKDGISIQGVNPNGQNYLEDYSTFMYPFERDEFHNVIEHSDYMSDDLCHAILDYREFLESKIGQFNTLLGEVEAHEIALTARQVELRTLEDQLSIINRNLDLANSMGNDPTPYIGQKNIKTAEVNAKKVEVENVTDDLNDLHEEIANLRASMNYNIFFTPTLLLELNDYILEKEYSNEFYSDEKDLYEEGKKEFEKVKIPQVILNMDIVNLFDIVEAQRDWTKVNLGDIIRIGNEKLKIDMTSKIIEIVIDDEGGSMSLTIANTKDILTDEEKLVKMLYQNNAASTVVDLSKTKWDGIDNANSQISNIINNTWDSVKTGISGGINNTITMNERGILVRSTEDENTYLVIQNGVLAITNDNGNTWKHAITANGIVGERIYGMLLAGQNLIIDASDENGTKTFTVDSQGVKILGSKLIITGGISEDNLDPDFVDSIVNLGSSYNGVVIDASNGLVITKSDNTIRTVLNATEGFSFEKRNGSTWEKKLYYNATTGNMVLDGEFNARAIKINGEDVLAGGLIKGQFIDKITVGQLDVTSAKITTAMIVDLVVGGNVTMGPNATISWSKVTGTPSIPVLPGYITSTKITSTTIESPTITAGTMTAGTFSSGSINGSTITGGNINVTTDLYVGSKIYMNASSFTADLVFNPSTYIWSDPAAASLRLVAGSGIYANGFRIDVAPTAVFG